MLVANDKFFVNSADIFDIKTPDNLIASESIHLVNCDMQDLSTQRDQYMGYDRRMNPIANLNTETLTIW